MNENQTTGRRILSLEAIKKSLQIYEQELGPLSMNPYELDMWTAKISRTAVLAEGKASVGADLQALKHLLETATLCVAALEQHSNKMADQLSPEMAAAMGRVLNETADPAGTGPAE